MKKLLLVICFTLALGMLGPVSAAAGHDWPWHRHHKDPAAAKASKSEKAKSEKAKPEKAKSEKGKKSLFHRGKSQDKAREKSAREEVAAGVSPGPKSVGWRRQSPGPAGAGAR
jgi:hypothetical protein